jgi:2-(1,2-epoxy-1,2-dihydrophenyl)acetyl-CoA isomerase
MENNFEHLLYTVADGVATITINRPEVYNAINNKISFELQDALKDCARNAEVRVVVLTAAGEKAFCTGQDLKEIQNSPNRSLADSIEKRYNPIVKAIRHLPKPVIARVNGMAVGAGCSFALAADLIVAVDTAYFSEIFINIGLVLDSGSSFFLPRLVGYGKAFELSTMANKVPAEEAARLGMIYKCVPAADLDAEVQKLTDYYKSAPTKAIGLIKKMLNRSYETSLDDMLEWERQYQQIAGSSEDYKEGTTAFAEKRKAVFGGR